MKKSKPKKKKVKKEYNTLLEKKLKNGGIKVSYTVKLPKTWGKVNEGKFFDLIEGNLTTNKEKI